MNILRCSPDRYEEEMEESDRIQMTVDNIRKSRKGGMLAEIHQIKDRHKQLEALTQTKRRAMTGSETVKPASQVLTVHKTITRG